MFSRLVACALSVVVIMLDIATLSVLHAARAQSDDWLSLPPRASSSSSSSSRTTAPTPATRASRIVREVLALYDGAQESTPDRTRIHRYLELPLNHLGLTVTYWDLAKGVPDADLVRRHRAIITWFGERISDPVTYLDWAAKQAGQGTRFVVLEFVGSSLNPDDLPKVNAFTKHLGFEISPRWIGPAEAGSVISRDTTTIDFEAKLDRDMPGYMVMEAKGNLTKSHLTLQSKDTRVTPQVRSSVILTGPGGGFAAVGFVRHYDRTTNRMSWLINPFSFLTSALALEQTPIPDTTTVAGRRIYFSHIDGDGWNGGSSASTTNESAAEVVLRELIAPYPDLPVSVGLIAADADPDLSGTDRAAQSAKRIFERPQVEVASHTHTHPFRWPYFEGYDRERELALVYSRRASALRSGEREQNVLARFAARDYAMQLNRAFQAYGDGMPRARMHRTFSLENEVVGALSVVRQLAPAGKPAPLYLWSGDTRPFEDAIRTVRAAGARNLNGGDSRLDSDFPSIMYVPPVGRPVGRERQIYAVNSNENTYTNGWRGPYDGQAKLTETWANTDAPRRLKGMNLYYHMYSGARGDSLATVKRLLDTIRNISVIPISASHYAAVADAFYDVETNKLGQLKWRIANRHALQTVRFDDAANLYVDLRQAQGVLGFIHHGKALYVALDESNSESVVALTSTKPDPRRPERPYLIDSRWMISKLKVGSCGFEADVQGYGGGDMTWAGLRPSAYTAAFTADRSDVEVLTETIVDQTGELKITVKGDAIGGGHIKVACTRTTPLRTGNAR